MAYKQKQRAITSAFRTRGYSNGLEIAGNGKEIIYATESQMISSEGHAFQRLGRHTRKEDIGGPFISQKIEVRLGERCYPQWIATVNSQGAKTRNYFILPLPHLDVRDALSTPVVRRDTPLRFRTWMDTVNPPGFSDSELTALGTQAINVMSPLNPVVDLTTGLAEFISERKLFSVPGKAGSVPGEYLNYQFGIAPTISMAKDLRKAMETQEKVIRQTARDSGRVIRRDGVIFEDKVAFDHSPPETDHSNYPVYMGIGPSTQINASGQLRISETIERRAWFSGAFTYYLPDGGLMRTLAELDAVYGVKPGVDTAWELLPFSWLVDYVSSAGSAIGNISKFANDGLIMHYGYIMGETISRKKYTLECGIRDANGTLDTDVTLFAEVVKTTKQRKPASPFGFGLLPGDLNARQWSILAALGMTYLK